MVIKSLKTGKAPGEDDIRSEIRAGAKGGQGCLVLPIDMHGPPNYEVFFLETVVFVLNFKFCHPPSCKHLAPPKSTALPKMW